MPKVAVVAVLLPAILGAGADEGSVVVVHVHVSPEIGLPNWSTNNGAGNAWLVPMTVIGLPLVLPVGTSTTVTASVVVTDAAASLGGNGDGVRAGLAEETTSLLPLAPNDGMPPLG